MSTNVYVRDFDHAAFNVLDGRRLVVVADGLTLFRGAQLAIDTTLVSPLHRDGTARRRAADVDGAALEAARRRKDILYLELSGDEGRGHLVLKRGDRPVPLRLGQSTRIVRSSGLARSG